MSEPHSPSFIELKKYLDDRCKKLKMIPISDATIKILDENEVNKTNLVYFEQSELKEINILIGSIKTLMCIINDEKILTKSNAAVASVSPISDNSSSINNNDDADVPPQVASNSNNTTIQTRNSTEPNVDGDTLLQQLSEASNVDAFKVVANKIRVVCSEPTLGSNFDCKRFVDIITEKAAFLDEDERVSFAIGWSLANVRAEMPIGQYSFEVDEKLLNLAYDCVTKAKQGETKITWIIAVTKAWESFRKHLSIARSSAEDPYHAKFARKFAPIVMELTAEKSFGFFGIDEGLRRIVLLWQSIALSDSMVCMKSHQASGNVQRPLFDFAALQLLLDNVVRRATTQETLVITLRTASFLVEILIPTETINVHAIAELIDRCLRKCTSPECLEKLVDLLYIMYRVPALLAQMDEHLRCGELVRNLKKNGENSLLRNENAIKLIQHFQESHIKKLKASIGKRLKSIGEVASPRLMEVLAKFDITGGLLGQLDKNDINKLSLDIVSQKELEGYVSRLAEPVPLSSSVLPGLRGWLRFVDTSSSTVERANQNGTEAGDVDDDRNSHTGATPSILLPESFTDSIQHAEATGQPRPDRINHGSISGTRNAAVDLFSLTSKE